ncbi:MAG: hypothetical protein JWO02_555 [Solirubrobacterales bacterium]|nr:hypothetical protein [Solirubrobacterales bacterium]
MPAPVLGWPKHPDYSGRRSNILSMLATITAKKKCCKDKPRCKKCPVTLKRLEHMGLAQRTGKRSYVLIDVVGKADMKKARARG